MVVKYRGEPQDAVFVQEYMKSAIQEQIEAEPSKLYAQDITGVKYIGERSYIENPDNSNSRVHAKEQGWGIVAMATVLSLLTLIALVMAIFIGRIKKRENGIKLENLRGDLDNCSTGSFKDPTGGCSSSSGSRSIEQPHTLTLMVSTEEMEPFPSCSLENGELTSSSDPNDQTIPHDSLSLRMEDLPPPPIELQAPPSRALKKQRTRKRGKSISLRQSNSSSRTFTPISETNSENDKDLDNENDESLDIVDLEGSKLNCIIDYYFPSSATTKTGIMVNNPSGTTTSKLETTNGPTSDLDEPQEGADTLHTISPIRSRRKLPKESWARTN